MRYIDLKILSSDIKLKKELAYNKVPLTSGSINDITCRFDFSSHWDDFYTKIAVFKGSGKTITVLLDNNSVLIPWECLTDAGNELFVGLTGIVENDNSLPSRRITTEFFSLGVITKGAETDNSTLTASPTLDLASQLVTQLNQLLPNENERQVNEQARNRSEQNRINQETARNKAESERVYAESNRSSVENTRVTSENKRVSAENARVQAENKRVNAENERISTESMRISAETERGEEEIMRATAENQRMKAETSRVNAENERVSAESMRISAETERGEEEIMRATAENQRIKAETSRVNAENNRVANFSQMQETITSLQEKIDFLETDFNDKLVFFYNSLSQLVEEHTSSTVLYSNNVHGLRYTNNGLQVYTNNSWNNV